MRIHSSSRRRSCGGVLVLALVITAGAAVGFAAWAMLLGQRTQFVEQALAGTQRRLAVENGRQIARQYGYAGVIPSNAGAALNAPLPGLPTGLLNGGISVTSWSGYAMESTTFPVGYNPISPASNGYPYGKQLAVSLPYSVSDAYPAPVAVGTGAADFTLEINSRSPLTSGDLLVVHRPTTVNSTPLPKITISGSLDLVGGRAVYFSPLSDALSTTARATQVAFPPVQPAGSSTLPVSRDSQTNAVILPGNLPLPILSGGSIAGALDTAGRLDVIDSPANGGNSFKSKVQTGPYLTVDTTKTGGERGVAFDKTTGTLTINLSEPLLPNIIAENHVAKIILTGQRSAADATIADPLGAVGFCYVETGGVTSRSLTEVRCQEIYNKRRFIMGIKKVPPASQSPKAYGSVVSCVFPQSNQAPVWRLMVVAENTPLAFTALGGPGIITLTGGIETDGSVAAPSATGASLRLLPEPDPRRLNRLAPRLAWVENHLNLDNGSL